MTRPSREFQLLGRGLFLRPDFSGVVPQFIRRNQTRQSYVPMNSYFKDRRLEHIKARLRGA